MAGRRNRRQKRKVLEGLKIEEMVSQGKGLARHEGMVVFVENAVPGDVADVLLTKKKKDYAIGKILNLHVASEQRVEPFCDHFGECGGCKWQYLDYATQIEYKQQIVIDAIKHVGKLEFPDLEPILGAEPNQYYRNKLEFTFSNKKWLTNEEIASGVEFERNAVGFHKPGMFDKVVQVDHCYLQGEPSNKIRNGLYALALEKGMSFYDIRDKHGFLRNLIVRTSTLEEVMVVLCVGEPNEEWITMCMDFLKETYPEITSLHYVINEKRNDTILDLDIQCVLGPGFIRERLGDFVFKISPKSFFQTNPKQAVALYDTVKDFAGLTGGETVYDLYTGTGTIGMYLSKDCNLVVGIEEVEAAIADAKFNAAENGVENCKFFAGDVKEMLTDEFVEKHGRPDVLVTDPPRNGMHADVVHQLLKLKIPRLVYVSCNPVTQARDLQLMSELYEIKRLRPVDMFPHTHHIENVAVLELKA